MNCVTGRKSAKRKSIETADNRPSAARRKPAGEQSAAFEHRKAKGLRTFVRRPAGSRNSRNLEEVDAAVAAAVVIVVAVMAAVAVVPAVTVVAAAVVVAVAAAFPVTAAFVLAAALVLMAAVAVIVVSLAAMLVPAALAFTALAFTTIVLFTERLHPILILHDTVPSV